MNKKHIVIIILLILWMYISNDSRIEILILLIIPIGVGILLIPSKTSIDGIDMQEVLNLEENTIDSMLDDPTWKRHEQLLDDVVNTNTVLLEDTNKQSLKVQKAKKRVKRGGYFKNIIDYISLKILMKKSTSKKCFIGIGGGGSNILTDISHINNKHLFIHINSDYNALVQKQSDYKILLKSVAKKDKWGCGGNTSCGLNLVDEKVKETINQFAADYETVYLIATLGGGVGSGSTPEIANYLKTINKKIIIYVTLPFSFEGNSRLTTAQESLIELKKYADQIIVLENNDLLKSNKGLRETFKLSSIDIYSRIVDEY
ncbi:MAG: hypothetical protein Q9M43_07105 [Sulfurimonas sp.]|nr:hypothetical protein [Sulfurimonas sp.]